MGLVKLMQEDENGDSANNYLFTLAGTADEIAAALVKGELDLAAVPVNLAAILYNRTQKEIFCLAVNTLGVLYILEAGEEIESIGDLEGKTIFATGKGTVTEYSLNYVLQGNQLTADKVTVEFRSEATELAALLEQGMATLAMLPQPYVTNVLARNPELRVALSLTEEWEKVSQGAGSFITGVMVGRKAFGEEHPEALAAFLKEYQQSIAFTSEDIEASAALVAKYGIVPDVAAAAKALPECNIVYLDGEEMQTAVAAFLAILYEANPQAVGDSLPDADFYYMPGN